MSEQEAWDTYQGSAAYGVVKEISVAALRQVFARGYAVGTAEERLEPALATGRGFIWDVVSGRFDWRRERALYVCDCGQLQAEPDTVGVGCQVFDGGVRVAHAGTRRCETDGVELLLESVGEVAKI